MQHLKIFGEERYTVLTNFARLQLIAELRAVQSGSKRVTPQHSCKMCVFFRRQYPLKCVLAKISLDAGETEPSEVSKFREPAKVLSGGIRGHVFSVDRLRKRAKSSRKPRTFRTSRHNSLKHLQVGRWDWYNW